MNLYTASNGLRVSMSNNIEWAGSSWTYHVEGRYSVKNEYQVLRIDLNRAEALRLRTQLNALLKATAPPRKARR